MASSVLGSLALSHAVFTEATQGIKDYKKIKIDVQDLEEAKERLVEEIRSLITATKAPALSNAFAG